jgi:DNA modification methylase
MTVRLIHGDCMEVLPTLSGIDAVITDPPYGVNERTLRLTNGRSNACSSNDYAPVVGDDMPFDPSPWLQ